MNLTMEEERAIRFNEAPTWASQQTIVKVLKRVKYTFEPISEYENTQFICVTRHPEYDPIKNKFRRMGFKIKEKFYSCPLSLTVCGYYGGEPVQEIMVFNREDVLNIIKDVPENYIGPENL